MPKDRSSTTTAKNGAGGGTKNQPAHKIRLGRVKATIWANQTEQGIRHSVVIRRLWKDGNDWRESDSFGRDELPLVCKVADMAHSWIYEQSQAASSTESAPPPEHEESIP